jgi:hypothetical protein
VSRALGTAHRLLRQKLVLSASSGESNSVHYMQEISNLRRKLTDELELRNCEMGVKKLIRHAVVALPSITKQSRLWHGYEINVNNFYLHFQIYYQIASITADVTRSQI